MKIRCKPRPIRQPALAHPEATMNRRPKTLSFREINKNRFPGPLPRRFGPKIRPVDFAQGRPPPRLPQRLDGPVLLGKFGRPVFITVLALLICLSLPKLETIRIPFEPQAIRREIYRLKERLFPTEQAMYRVTRPLLSPNCCDDVIYEAAALWGVEPALIKAVIMTESAFNPQAVSSQGAQGLMQIMPGTALELGLENPFDPQANIYAGAKCLRLLRDQFGTLEKTLIAYNAGQGWTGGTAEGNPKVHQSRPVLLPTIPKRDVRKCMGRIGPREIIQQKTCKKVVLAAIFFVSISCFN